MVRVDPCNACNFKCQYCPTAFPDLLEEVGRPKGIMAFDLFTKIVDDMKEFGAPLKKLYLYKDGEPLMNKRLPDMIAYAKSRGVANEIWTTTNGSLLKPELNRKLVEAGLDQVKVSIQGINAEAYRDIAKFKIDYEKFRENLSDLFQHRKQLRVHVKIVDTGLTAQEKEKFFHDFEPMADSVHIDSLMGWSASASRDFTLGTNPTTGPDGRALVRRDVCPFPFYTLSVNFDGSVSVCCVDWAHATVVGDLNHQTLKAVWEGDALHEFRLMHLRRQREKNKACGDCQYIQTLPDNLDADASSLEQRLTSLRRPGSAGYDVRGQE